MRALAWALSIALVAQVLVPLQSHTRFAADESGQVVLICTLAGNKTISLDEFLGRDAPVDDAGLDEIHNPAMLFSQLLAENVSGLTELLVRPFFLSAVDVDTTPVFSLPNVPLGLPRNRDPPRA